VVGDAAPWEVGLGLLVVQMNIFTYVCVCLICRVGITLLLPPRFAPREQVAVASFVLADTLIGEMTFTALLEPVNSSSTQVPLFMPRTMQPVYSLEDCFVCRHPDGCEVRV